MLSDRIDIIEAIERDFPITTSAGFPLYPFSNERGHQKILAFLQSTNPNIINGHRVAILFGESNYLSMLPELSLHADIIILADIEPNLHKHTRHLRDCLILAKNIEEFDELYCKNNPIENVKTATGFSNEGKVSDLLILLHNKASSRISLEKYHVLYSQERFNKCKEAAHKLHFVNGNLNLMSTKQCYQLACLLKNKSAVITICNLTNIHQYDDADHLKVSVPTLLHESPNCLVMHSNNSGRGLVSKISIGLKSYYHNDSQSLYPWRFVSVKRFNTFLHQLNILNQFIKYIAELHDFFPDGAIPQIIGKRKLNGNNTIRVTNLYNLQICTISSCPEKRAAGNAVLSVIRSCIGPEHQRMIFNRNIMRAIKIEPGEEAYDDTNYEYLVREDDKILESLSKPVEKKSGIEYKYYAASTIQFWYRRSRDENKALDEIKQRNGSTEDSRLAKSIFNRRGI